jgi:CYTH domain-containing protein
MAKEIERKFLIANRPVPYDGIRGKFLKQGYVMLSKDKQLRVRIIDEKKAFICLKYTSTFIRDEYEYEIPLLDAIEIYDKCEYTLTKTRFTMKRKYTIDIDVYDNGLVIIEVEFKNADDANTFVPLDWMGTEVTGNKKYSNITIAKENKKI